MNLYFAYFRLVALKSCTDILRNLVFRMDYYLITDLSRGAYELGVVGKRCQVFNSLKEGSCSETTPVPVLLREIPIQTLQEDDKARINICPFSP